MVKIAFVARDQPPYQSALWAPSRRLNGDFFIKIKIIRGDGENGFAIFTFFLFHDHITIILSYVNIIVIIQLPAGSREGLFCALEHRHPKPDKAED